MGYNSQIYAANLPHRAKTVYMYLRDRADKEGKSFPSIRTIGRELNLSRSTVKRALQDLEKACLLSIEHRYRDNGGNSSNLYILL